MDIKNEESRRIVQIDGVKPLTSRKKRRNSVITALIVLLLAFGVFIFLFALNRDKAYSVKGFTTAQTVSGNFTSSTEASGTVVYPIQISIASPQEGYADYLYVKEGDLIDTDTILASLYIPDLEDSRDDYTAQLAQARISLEELEIEYLFSIRTLETSLERLLEDIAEEEKNVDVLKSLSELRSSRQADYETAEKALKKLIQQREDLELSLEREKIKKDIALKKQQAQISQLEINLARTNRSLAEGNIRSPMSGEVLSLNEDLSVAGSLITKNTSLFVVADKEEAFLDFQVAEQYASLLSIGAELKTTVSNNTFTARVTQIGRVASLSSDGLSATVTVRAKPLQETTLTPGAQAAAEIILGIRENTLMLPRGAYLTTGGQRYVYRVEGSRAYKTQVTFGEIKGNQVEVISGLSAGDIIITSGYQDYLDQEMVELKL